MTFMHNPVLSKKIITYTQYYYKTKICVALKVYHGINIYHIAYANPEKIEI